MKELIKAEEEKTLFIGRHGSRSLLLERINWCMTAILERR